MKTKRIDKRKILLVLPLIILLVAGVAFYLVSQRSGVAEDEAVSAGINTALPDAQFRSADPADKMGIYQLTEGDTANDDGMEKFAGRFGLSPVEDPKAQQIQAKLDAINREIQAPQAAKSESSGSVRSKFGTDVQMNKDVAKLESLMKSMQTAPEEDPEMRQLHSLMDKIMAVQNPELAISRQDKPVSTVPDSLFKAIPAVIAGNQRAVQGSVVELRLLDSVVINGQVIPKGHAVYGLAEFSNQRLNLQIKNIRLGTSVIPVNLTVFDQRDAMPGINAPEALLTEAAGRGASGAMSAIDITGFDLSTQIAGAGLDAAKSLMNRKIRRVRQKLKAGYPLLLRDNSRKVR